MKEFISDIFAVAFISGFFFLIVSVVSYFYPPKKINAWIGYCTAASLRSQERWDFAQKFSSLVRIKSSLVLITASLTGYLLPQGEYFRTFGSLMMIILWVRYMTVITDRELNRRFSKLNSK